MASILTSTVSIHLSQITIIEDFFANSPKSNSNIYKRNWKKNVTKISLFQSLRMLTGKILLILTKKS